jgi:hypothetical protein
VTERPRIRQADDGSVTVAYEGRVRTFRAPSLRTGAVLEVLPDGATVPVHERFATSDPPLVVRPGQLLEAIRRELRRARELARPPRVRDRPGR